MGRSHEAPKGMRLAGVMGVVKTKKEDTSESVISQSSGAAEAEIQSFCISKELEEAPQISPIGEVTRAPDYMSLWFLENPSVSVGNVTPRPACLLCPRVLTALPFWE